MISVDTALAKIFALATPLESETVPLSQAANRVLAKTVTAGFDQPPFAASAMDGYAVRSADIQPGAQLDVIGEVAAGQSSPYTVQPGQGVRIFTGAPIPQGADRVVIQEDVSRTENTITLTAENIDPGPYVRPKGADFKAGFTLAPPRRLSPSDLSLLAAMNTPQVAVTRQPVVALMATGDELVMPGETPEADQIVASNIFGLKAMAEAAGARVNMLPIARDNETSLRSAFYFARGADLIVAIGGASDGDYDLVSDVAETVGLKQSFYKVAMRPGKPLAAGRLGDAILLGLPGNPVSALVCGRVFMVPLIEALSGLPAQAIPRHSAPLLHPIPANGPREHYMRAQLSPEGLRVFDRQDSALLTVASEANALVIRPPQDGSKAEDDLVEYCIF